MKAIVTLLFSISFITLFAQNNHQQCGILSHLHAAQNGRLPGSETGQNIDVVYHRIYWRMNPDTTVGTNPIIRGSVTTYFRTKVANVSSINFDLIRSSFNNANLIVRHHGNVVTHSFPTTGNVDRLNITIPNIPTLGTLDSVTINYGGEAIAVNGEAYGLVKTGTGTAAYYWTLAESYEDRNFMPCKHDMTDKVDSMLITISTPPVHLGVTNGRMISDVTIGSNNREITYKLTYPIPTYLIAFSVGRFNRQVRTPVNISGTSVPITYYRRTALTAANLAAADVCRDQMTVYSQFFGDYPFKNDGYGLMEFGFGGGMEHQTISSMSTGGFTSWSLNAHEIAHQWFGDKVTFATWSDLWIAEGFAKYLESFYAEKASSPPTSHITLRSTLKSDARAASATPITVTNIANSNTIWTAANNEAVYKRGAMLVSMLRALCGDTKFYQACNNILNDPSLAYNAASTNDIKLHFEAVTGRDLDEFFNDWIYNTGNADYNVNWGNFGNRINIQLDQITTGSVSHFSMPVVLRINGLSRDTLVTIYDDNNIASLGGARTITNTVSFNLGFTPTSITFDPFHQTMANLGTITFLQTLNTSEINFTAEDKNPYNQINLRTNKNNTVQQVVLEKSSNGVQFTALSNLTKSSESNDKFFFDFMDYNPFTPTTYYRIKFVNMDGSVEFSNIVRVNKGQFEKIKVLGNPVTNNTLRISVGTNVSNYTKMAIIDMNGKIVQTEQLNSNNIINTNIAKLPAAKYIIYLFDDKNNLIASATFLKQ